MIQHENHIIKGNYKHKVFNQEGVSKGLNHGGIAN